MEGRPWFRTLAELAGTEPAVPELTPEAYEAARWIMDAAEELGPIDLVFIDLQTPVATRFVAMPVTHKHGPACGRA